MRNKLFLFLALICVVTILPFMGLTDFNTKGEPREAIVAYSMLETGNWTLPVNNGGDIAYKPPFFHWSIAAISAITGKVTEYTSRMPSALALIAMVLAGFCFFAKRRGKELAFLMALITLTNFEVHRAGVNCRVDMVLTAFIVLALYQLFRWSEKGLKGLPWLAILFMGCATLTKGPVGFILPCMVTGVYLLIRGTKFMKAFTRLLLAALVSCILPAIWYIAAYQAGGDDFMALIMEENFGRFMGKMSYASHENPAYYNLITLFAGYVPYTLLLLLSLFSLKYTKLSGKPREWWNKFTTYIREMDDTRLFSLLSIVLIFIFYCIPKSKRSVYLLPIYPFIAYFLAEYILYLIKLSSKALKVYGSILSGIAILLVSVFVAVRLGLVPETIFKGRHAMENIAFLNALKDTHLNILEYGVVLLPLFVALFYFTKIVVTKHYDSVIYTTIALTFALYMSLDSFYQPTILNMKSDKPVAEQLKKLVPEGKIYSYVSVGMLRFFTINFYNDDRVALIDVEKPQEGYMVVGEQDFELFKSSELGQSYAFEEVLNTNKKGCDIREILHVYRFSKK